MQPTQFTVTGDDRAEQRIRRDLDRITESLTASFPSLVCLALIGAFGRGEGAVVLSTEGPLPWNDYDLVLITQTREGWSRLSTMAKNLAGELGIRGVDIVPFLPHELHKKAATMLLADARAAHVVLAGDREILGRIPRCRVPEKEALILLLNRMVCLLEAPPEPLVGSAPEPLFSTSQLSKALFAIVDARLVRAGRYATTYREKTQRFLGLPDTGIELKEAVTESFEFRLRPGARAWGAPRWFLARDAMVEQIGILLGAEPGSSPLAVARSLWGTRYPSCGTVLRQLARGRRPETGCTAVQCAELLTLAAASPEGAANAVLLSEAVRYMNKTDSFTPPAEWKETARLAVRLWFNICHG